MLLYAAWFFSQSMPWQGPGDAPSRGMLVLNALLLSPEIVATWSGGWADFGGLVDRLPVVLKAGLILLFAWGVGTSLLASMRLDRLLRVEETLLLATSAGLAIISWWMCVLGQMGFLNHADLILIGLVIVWLMKNRDAVGLFERFKELAKSSSEETPNPMRWWPAWVAAPIVLFTLGVALVPPFEYDVLEYHALVPKQWFLAGQIATLPGNVYSGMPMGAVMWSLLAMHFLPWQQDPLHGVLTGKLLIAVVTLFNPLLLYMAGRRLAGDWAGISAALAALGATWLVQQSGTGLVDGVWAYFTMAAVYPLLIVLHQRNKSEPPNVIPVMPLVLLSGLFAGCAFSVKYPALLTCIVPLLVLWFVLAKFDWKLPLAFGVVVILMAAPWMAKNITATGNPVYPLAGNVFATDIRSDAQIEQWNRAHQVPVNANGNRYSIDQAMRGLGTLLGTSPWAPLAVVPLAVVGLWEHRRKEVVVLVALLASTWLVWWGFSHRLERFLIPAIPLGCLLAGWGAAKLAKFPAGKVILGGVLLTGLVTAFALANLPQSIQIDPRVFVSLDHLKHNHTTQGISFLNNSTPEGDVVLATGDAALFYLNRPVLYHTCFDDAPFEPVADSQPEEIAAWLSDKEIRWIYVHWGEIQRFRSPGNYGFPEYVDRNWFGNLEEAGVLQKVDALPETDRPQPIQIYRVLPVATE